MTSKLLSFALILFVLISCAKKEPLIQKPERFADIQRMLTVQRALTSKSELPIWDIFKQPLAESEKQAMEFLYAYMPLSDLADYKSDFFLKNSRFALQARDEMAWGKTIPEEEFLHFVLPLRVNNENLDNFREVMYPEIKARVKGLSMKDAALEINHWCHEKVSYRGTDSRTSAPLSAVKKSFGRCGEESTFTVTALRTAGIPARQVYTPRWAHSDDNHAWVEVWIDGKWNYLGACEPDVDLNMGWFSEPSRRAMLVHTRAYGHYFGNDPVITATDRFSELNLTANYATVKKITVLVKNSAGAAVDSAKVEFQLYNYAEYYPIAKGFTSKTGEVSLITGMGDLVIWASKEGKFAYQRFSVPEKDTLNLILNQVVPVAKSESFDFIPPHAAKVELTVTDQARKENTRRMSVEDSIRGAYMQQFKDSTWIAAFATKTKLPFDTLSRFFKLSYGNWDQLERYLESNAPNNRRLTLDMAIQISDKDFSDTPESILTDHLVEVARSGAQQNDIPKEIFNRYLLSPRIGLEILTPWRSFLKKAFDPQIAKLGQSDMTQFTKWIRENITLNSVANAHSRTPLSPIGVFNLRVADPISRDIFFVALCRTFGIPSRLNPETLQPEYYTKGEWYRAGLDEASAVQPEKGKLILVDKNNSVAPQYALHFTIAILQNGFYHTLEFPEGKVLTDSKEPIALETGNYALVTGNRLQDGSVLSAMTFFVIEKGKVTTVPIELRKQPGVLTPSGKLNLDALRIEKIGAGKVETLAQLIGGKHSVVVLIDPDKEPSKHILNDLGPYVDHFNKWGGQFVFAMAADKASQVGVLKTYHLPGNTIAGIDAEGNILKAATAGYGDGLKDKLPLVMLCDEAGNIYLFSSGYKIGVGEQLLKMIAGVEAIVKSKSTKISCTTK